MADPVAVGDYPGVRIEYFDAPRRRYTVNGETVPSVTTALGVLNKPALVHWAAKVTLEGAWKLLHRKGYRVPEDVHAFKDDMRRFGYDHNAVRDKAADRGLDVHAILEDWIGSQKIPNAADFPEDRRGYIRALAKWLMEWRPQFRESELIVGSAIHGFAGRRDTVATIDAASLPDTVTSAEGFPAAAREGGRVLLDLKTAKGVYGNSMYPQLAAYELAGVECGAEPTVAQGIVRVGSDGTYEVRWSDATAEDFLAVLRAYKSQQRWTRRR